MSDHYRELTAVLARVRTRWRTLSGLAALTRAVAAASALALAALVAYLIASPGEGGLVVLFLLPAAGLVGAAGWFLWLVRRRPDDRAVARLIEERCPELEDRLATAVELGSRSDERGASVLLAPLVADAAFRAGDLDLDRIIPTRALRRVALAAGLSLAVLLAILDTGRGPG